MNSACLSTVHDVVLVLVTYKSHVVFKIKAKKFWKFRSETILSLMNPPHFQKQLDQGCPVCSRANTSPRCILSSEMCSSHQQAENHFRFAPFCLHIVEIKHGDNKLA